MKGLEEFQSAAREGGFVDVEECEGGSVLWLRKKIPDAITKTHQRICIDGGSSTLTVYWMSAIGKIESKMFRDVSSFQAWFRLQPVQ